MLVIGIKLKEVTKFTLTGNIIYTNSMKCKRVTRAMLASKLYTIITKVDMLIALLSIINIITNKLEIKQLPIVVYINSLSLYKYIIKLDIKQKRNV